MFGFVRRFFIRRRLKKVLPQVIRLQKWFEENPREQMEYIDALKKYFGENEKK